MPQSYRHPRTDGRGSGRIYGDLVFASVLVALAGRAALVLASQLAGPDGAIVVAHVMASTAAPLAGGSGAAARRRADLHDAGE